MKYKGTLIVVKGCRKALKFYQDMFKKWGLETGEEWIPGKR